MSGAVTPEQLQSNSEALSVMEHYFQQRNEDGSSDLLSEIMDQTRMLERCSLMAVEMDLAAIH